MIIYRENDNVYMVALLRDSRESWRDSSFFRSGWYLGGFGITVGWKGGRTGSRYRLRRAGERFGSVRVDLGALGPGPLDSTSLVRRVVRKG